MFWRLLNFYCEVESSYNESKQSKTCQVEDWGNFNKTTTLFPIEQNRAQVYKKDNDLYNLKEKQNKHLKDHVRYLILFPVTLNSSSHFSDDSDTLSRSHIALPLIWTSFHLFHPLLAFFSLFSVSFAPLVPQPVRHVLFPLCCHLSPPSVAPASNGLEAVTKIRKHWQVSRKKHESSVHYFVY